MTRQMRGFIRFSIGLVVGLALMTSCGGDSTPSEGGQLTLPLATTSPSGVEYRLRNYTIVQALLPDLQSGFVIESKNYPPEQTQIDAQIAAGSYRVTLEDGWYMEHSANGQPFTPIDAVLRSPNPTDIVIRTGETTTLTLVFRVDEGDINFGPGRILVDVEVEERLCGDNVAEAPEICDGTDLGDQTGVTCVDAGFTGGTLACNTACDNLDLTGCTGGPPGWTCSLDLYGGADGCDCGCGIVDPDCADDTVGSCDFCGEGGSCNPAFSQCPGDINPTQNWLCGL